MRDVLISCGLIGIFILGYLLGESVAEQLVEREYSSKYIHQYNYIIYNGEAYFK